MNLLSRLLRLLGLGGTRREEPGEKPRLLEPERAALVARLDRTPFGVNCHTARPELLRTLVGGGIRWYRLDVDWDLIEASEGRLDWSALDASVGELQSRGVSLLGSIAYTPTWASGGNPALPRTQRQGLMPRDPGRFLAFVDAVLDRYGSTFQALAIWNEPNQPDYFRGSRADYLGKILRPGLERLKERAPAILRCGPDLSSSPPRNPHDWLEAALGEAGDLLDVVTHHQYDGKEMVDRRAKAIEDVRRIVERKGLGDRELWITETGWRRGQVTAQQQAESLAGMMSAMAERGPWWTKTFWFDSHGPGEGLLGTDNAPDQGQPFPVFDRYARVIADAQRDSGGGNA